MAPAPRTAAAHATADRADLHLHTTCSDGTYTPAQIVDLARRSGLAAIAITDHDTTAGIDAARQAAGDSSPLSPVLRGEGLRVRGLEHDTPLTPNPSPLSTGERGACLEIVPAIELTAEFRGKEMHLLGYFIRPEDAGLCAGLETLHRQRVERFAMLLRRLRGRGLSLDEGELQRRLQGRTPGRRHLAEWLVETRQASTIQDAFRRYLGHDGRVQLPAVGLPLAEAIAVLRGAGGVAVWAHPSYDCRQKNLRELVTLGLQGIEVEYPGYRPDRVRQLRQLAADFGLVTSGGSDCHGPTPLYRTVGACSITRAELEMIRNLSN